jgi:N-acetyl-gamma-glutamyl-phosphate reductase
VGCPVTKQIGIVGASGYGGAELLRLAAGHPGLNVAIVAAHSKAGEPIASLFPNMPGTRVFDAIDLDALGALDLVVLATPHGPALDLAPKLVHGGTPVVDLSAAFRLDAAGFEQWYGEVHPHPELTPAAYGLPEHHRAALEGAMLVANPGCYPTATMLALRPLLPLVESGSIVVDAMSGTSGGGRAPGDGLHFAHVSGSVSAYGAPAHRHTGEIEQWLAHDGLLPGPVQFTPHLLPTARGLLSTSTATLRAGVTQSDVDDALRDAYGNEPFVHVLPAGTWPTTKALHGSNGCQLSAVVDGRTGRVVASSAIDNLGKGAAGQALQNVNILLGLGETTGLTSYGTYP